MIDFIAELLTRLFGKTPWFFKVIQILSVVTAIVTGLPQFLTDAGIIIPDAWNAISSQVVSIASLVATFISQLAVTTSVKEEKNIPD